MSATKTLTKWAIDPTHSEVQFKVKHLVISTVTGNFNVFQGTVQSENEDFSDANIFFEITVDSIDTNQAQRDGHLRSPDFFDVEKYPTIKFEGTSFQKVKGNEYKLKGDLTIKNVTKPIELNVEYGGSATDFYGNKKAGFEVTGKINRKEYGLTWDGITEAGAIVVGEEVKLNLNIQLAQQA
ncbi:MAG TPA: YceI family protein [Cytophagaceae bacterium]|nr:YceI family protein [Cytophagaceae bacterium]